MSQSQVCTEEFVLWHASVSKKHEGVATWWPKYKEKPIWCSNPFSQIVVQNCWTFYSLYFMEFHDAVKDVLKKLQT
jgi:hypothetical protein